MAIDADVIDFAAGLLLRYFRGGTFLESDEPRVDHRRDLEMLKGHWAVSGPVRDLVAYVLGHPHETQSLLTFRLRIDDSMARGRIDARRTWSYRIQSGIPSAIVALEPVRSFDTGPNLILAWVLSEAAAYTARLAGWQGPTSPYSSSIEQAQSDIHAVRKLEALREPLRAVSVGRRPSPGAIRTAARTRVHIYRLALDAYLLLQGLERGNAEAINIIARTALIGPLEEWRRFELAVGLAAGEALASACNLPLCLHLLGGHSSGPIITTGRFAIHWQQRTPYYNAPDMEPSEVVIRDILNAFGFSWGADRPDLVVIDRKRSTVVAVIEVKYLAGDTANARFREAVEQVVRYARGYVPPAEIGQLVNRSLVALSNRAPVLRFAESLTVTSVDFAGIKRSELASWARRVTSNLD